MAPKLTLVYFNLKGRAECIRLLLHYANVDFIDRKVEFADWSTEKEEAPNHTLPYIDYQGKKYGEALPIARFLAKKYRLLGSTELEQFESDILINHVDALRSAAMRFKTDTLLTVEQKMSFVDLLVYDVLDRLVSEDPDFAKRLESEYPLLRGLAHTVASAPNIRAYLDTRQDTFG
ncbi:glutathione s-transferase [Elysia marginata]|uniref:glutathione transferase n=1 Tax=Elysia marginata TaxID=1093978 RepID=A0AAV4J278_9GAST|nr:glutathione s-transferase [Elysia marginata]